MIGSALDSTIRIARLAMTPDRTNGVAKNMKNAPLCSGFHDASKQQPCTHEICTSPTAPTASSSHLGRIQKAMVRFIKMRRNRIKHTVKCDGISTL
jgi:hypothetical protein